MLDIQAEMDKLDERFQEIQKIRNEKIEEIKKIDEETLQLRGAFAAFQKMKQNSELAEEMVENIEEPNEEV